MARIQIQLPDHLYEEAKRVAREREMTFTEVVRRGLEYITYVYPPLGAEQSQWSPPETRKLGELRAPVSDWRLLANEAGLRPAEELPRPRRSS